jgi:hypothetical protein
MLPSTTGVKSTLARCLEMLRMRLLVEENAKLKRIVAGISLGKAILQDVLAKKR